MARGGRRRKARVTLPGYGGRRSLGRAEVDNPYGQPGEKETVTINVRESALEEMFARRLIEPCQKKAGDRFRTLYELVAIQKGGAVDPSKEPVDTSGTSDPIPDRVIDAGRRLGEIAKELGKQDYAIVSAICGEGLTVLEMSRRWEGCDEPSNRARNYVSRRLRDALLLLARFWRLA